MNILKIMGNFLKNNIPEIVTPIFGAVLTIALARLTDNFTWLVGVAETFFVELSLFSIRKEAKSAFKKYINDQTLQTIDELKLIQAELRAVSLGPLLAKRENQVAIQKEFNRMQKTLLELQDGKRRIYEDNDLYKEQKKIILQSSRNILAIHIVKGIKDLHRWDPETMDRTSSFYTELYSSFEKRKSAKLRKQRIVILPKSVSEIKNRYNRIVKENPQSLDELGNDDEEIKEFYQVIERVMCDQKNLGFQVRFVSTTDVVFAELSHAVSDCLIGDTKYGFEFSKSASADVYAYAINSKKYIIEQIRIFEELWSVSEEW